MKRIKSYNREFISTELGLYRHILKKAVFSSFSLVEAFDVEKGGCIYTFEKMLPNGFKKGVQISKLYQEKGFFGFQYRFSFYQKEV